MAPLAHVNCDVQLPSLNCDLTTVNYQKRIHPTLSLAYLRNLIMTFLSHRSHDEVLHPA